MSEHPDTPPPLPIRFSLWVAGPFNLTVAALLAMPASAPGRLLDLPPEVPALYAGLSSLFVALFGFVYLWLALRPVIDRSLLWLGALGKLCAFGLAAGLWLSGELGPAGLLAATGDLALAALWLGWLSRGQ